jgi:hypothetical protein
MKCLTMLALSLALTPMLQAADRDVEVLASKIDQQITAAWAKDVKPAALADDAEFFRRVHLDLAGRIPSVTEARDFLDDDSPNKRRLWVERILQADPEDPSYKEAFLNHFSNVWRAWLLAQTNQQNAQQPALETWLRQRFKANIGYDQLVRELLTQPSGGTPALGSATVFYQANENKPENLAGSTARLFLGVKLECAQCHDHPFDKWTRNQFWQFAAFFTDLSPQQARPGTLPRPRGTIKMMGLDRVFQARFLDGKEPDWKNRPGTRPTLAEWMTAKDNPFFARAAVNRLWGYFFGVGLVEHVDGSTDQPPAAHMELLDEMTRQFVAHNYDLKFLIRAITASQTYQRTSAVSHPSHKSPRLFARMSLRGISPEQLFDSLAEATEYGVRGSGNPQPARGQFLARFVAQEHRIEYQTSILQALYLMNNEFTADRTSLEKNRTLANLAEQRTSTARKVESLFLVVLSRKPRPEERERFVKYVEKGGPTGDSKKALADVFWVLLNSPEFLLNH